MKNKKLSLGKEELEAVYQIVKSYEDELPEEMDEYWHFHNDFDEEPIEKKIIDSILDKIGEILPEKNKIFDKEFLRKKYHSFNNEINEKAYGVIERAFDQLKTIEIEYFNMESQNSEKGRLMFIINQGNILLATTT